MIPGLLTNGVSTALYEFIVTGYEIETWPFFGKFHRLVEELNVSEEINSLW